MKHVGLIFKLLLLGSFIAVGVFVYVTCSGGSCIQRIDEMPPDVNIAPYQIPTVTYTYYAEEAIENANGSVTMSNWYERQSDGKWLLHKDTLTIPPVLRPEVVRR